MVLYCKLLQRTTKQRPSILYRPNEVRKLVIFGNKVFVYHNDRSCKLRCNVISLATLTQWHREWKSRKAGSYNFRTDSYTFRKGMITGDPRFQFVPKFPQMEDYQQKKLKMSQSCTPWQKLHRKCESCAALHSTCVVWWWCVDIWLQSCRENWNSSHSHVCIGWRKCWSNEVLSIRLSVIVLTFFSDVSELVCNWIVLCYVLRCLLVARNNF